MLYFATTEEVLLARLLERGKTSGREDDNAASITKRFRTYKVETMPVIEYYSGLGKVAEVRGAFFFFFFCVLTRAGGQHGLDRGSVWACARRCGGCVCG